MTDTRVYTVALALVQPTCSSLQRAVLASVPGRFLVVDQLPADVLVVSGADAGWPDIVAAAVDGGVRGALVVDPGLVDADRVLQLAGQMTGRAAVAVQSPYVDDRAWGSVRDRVRSATASASLLDSLATVPADATHDDLVRALIGQVAIVRPLLEPLGRLRLLHLDEGNYLLVGGTSHQRVTLAGVRSAADRHGLTLDVVAPDSRWEVRFDATALGSPTTISHHTASGAAAEPLVHESGRRVSWERLHQTLSGNGRVGYDLHALAADLAIAEVVLHGPRRRIDHRTRPTEE